MIRKLPINTKTCAAPACVAMPQFAEQMWAAMWDDVDMRIFWRDNFSPAVKNEAGQAQKGGAARATS